MKVAYVTELDPASFLNEKVWAKRAGHQGRCYHIAKALTDAGSELELIGPLHKKFALLPKLKWRLYEQVLHQKYQAWAEPTFSQSYAQQIRKKIAGLSPDFLLCPDVNLLTYLKIETPKAIWVDTLYQGLIDFYGEYSNLCAETQKHLRTLDRLALENCQLTIFSSDWAANVALDYYQADPKKVKVVPFGANISSVKTLEDLQKILTVRKSEVCRLLFIGVDWIRKGGNIAAAVAESLNQMGIPTELWVVGCRPRLDSSRDWSFVKSLGFISRGTAEGEAKIEELFSQSHFLILPTLADCSPAVLREASAFGLPCVTSNVGGIPSIIRDGVNGKTFPLPTDIGDYRDYIAENFQGTSRYEELVKNCFGEYEARLNWRVAGQAVQGLLMNEGGMGKN